MSTRPAKTHAGGDLPAAHVLFAEAPAQIGEVLSARSTLMEGMATAPNETDRGKSALFWFCVGYFLAYVYFDWAWMIPYVGYPGYILAEYSPTARYWGKELVALGLAAWGWFKASKSWEVTYVGKDGIAGFGFVDDPRTAKPTLLLRFADAAELRTGQTRHFRNGRYEGTSYFYAWTDAAGKAVADFGGWHYVNGGDPGPEDPFHFGRAAEIAWTQHLLGRAAAELEKTQKIVFKVSGGDWIAVGAGFLELCFGGKPAARCDKADLAEVSIQTGWFTIKRKDATVGWFSSDGIFKFPFSSMANARFFLFCVEQIGGIKIG